MDIILAILMIMVMCTLSTVSSIPILRLDVCSESEATFTCTVTESTTLQWGIDFLSGADINRVLFSLSDTIGKSVSANRGTGVLYTFRLTSSSPLTSTVTTNTLTDLSGATVSCFTYTGLSSSADVATLALHKTPCNLTAVISTQTTDLGDPDMNIIVVRWDGQQFNTALNLDQNYTITISPPTADSVTIFHTSNTSLLLALLYDQDYNISVVASNCIGNSTPVEIHIRIIDNCSLMIDDVVINYCLPNEFMTTPNNEMMAPKSTNDSSSDLAPQQHGSIDPLVPSMIVSHLFLSALSCTVGIFIGCLLHGYYVSRKTQVQATSSPEPTEISLSANEAYGKINR